MKFASAFLIVMAGCALLSFVAWGVVAPDPLIRTLDKVEIRIALAISSFMVLLLISCQVFLAYHYPTDPRQMTVYVMRLIVPVMLIAAGMPFGLGAITVIAQKAGVIAASASFGQLTGGSVIVLCVCILALVVLAAIHTNVSKHVLAQTGTFATPSASSSGSVWQRIVSGQKK